ncbi:MAG TPA: hypothetical protein VK939_07745 [Longimicrobiales bacterium]|nr:hypothetical protein [Longimicrobiales bacterium]
MFDDWKRAWREAVANFQRELGAEEDGTSGHYQSLRRELATARGALQRLESEIETVGRNAAAERESEQVCRRREGMATAIGDVETARIAAEYAARHAERAAVLERKVEVLGAERTLLVRDLEVMAAAVAEAAPSVTDAGPGGLLDDDEAREWERRRLDRLQRERDADARLEELKRRMRS